MSDIINCTLTPIIEEVKFDVEYYNNNVLSDIKDIIYIGEEVKVALNITNENVVTFESREVINLTIIKGNGIGFGTKKSGVDAGTQGDRAFDDDYDYVCTTTGDSETAIWKKSILLRT